jgi:hypothetical protein
VIGILPETGSQDNINHGKEYRMTTQPVDSGAGAAGLRSTSFERFAGTCAVLAGVAGFLYAVAFVVLQNILLSGLFLMLGGLLSTAVLAGVYDRLRETDASFALWAVLSFACGDLLAKKEVDVNKPNTAADA